MLKIAKILVPVDFSPQGAGAARYAGALARHFGSEVTLLHVNPMFVPAVTMPQEFGMPVDLGWITALESARRKELADYQKAEFQDVRVERVVVTGDPAHEIVERAQQERADLIVMPTHGRGPFRRFLLGSVTAKVLHDADCPVWTGAHLAENAAAELQMIRHVLCAVDHSDASDRALAWAAGFAGEFKSVLTVVRATPPLPAPDDVLNPDWEDARREEAEKQIRCLQAKIGTHANILVEEGDPAEIVARAALERRADLVVIGRSHKKSGLGRAQEHAYQIVRDSPCPVVSI